MIAGASRGGQKTHCTKPLPRRRAMGIESTASVEEHVGRGPVADATEAGAGDRGRLPGLMRDRQTPHARSSGRCDEGGRHTSPITRRARRDPHLCGARVRVMRCREAPGTGARAGRDSRHEHLPVGTDGTGPKRDAGERLVAVAIVRGWRGSCRWSAALRSFRGAAGSGRVSRCDADGRASRSSECGGSRSARRAGESAG